MYYRITIANTGNIALTNLVVSDMDIDLSGCTWTDPLGAGLSTSCVVGPFTAIAGTHTNTASAHSTETPLAVTDDASYIASAPLLGLAKRVVSITEVSAGTWDVTFEFLVRNYGNVDLPNLQITDDLSATFSSGATYIVQSLTSSQFSGNTGYNGAGANTSLLLGTDTLLIGQEGTIQLVVRVVPSLAGPFNNTAVASSDPGGTPVSDTSSDGTDPDNTTSCAPTDTCVNNDGDPTNNTKPTQVSFGPILFDPPFGIKLLDPSGEPVLNWSMIWINASNIVAVNARVSDPIPAGTTFEGIVVCTPDPTSTTTVTTACYYEAPSLAFPRRSGGLGGYAGAGPECHRRGFSGKRDRHQLQCSCEFRHLQRSERSDNRTRTLMEMAIRMTPVKSVSQALLRAGARLFRPSCPTPALPRSDDPLARTTSRKSLCHCQ